MKVAASFFILFALLVAPLHADTPRPDPQRWAGRINGYVEADRKQPPPADAILFVGSSSIAMWDTTRWFPDRATINRGFGGSILHDQIHYYDQVIKPYDAKAIVIFCGDNDIAVGLSPREVADDFALLMQKIRTDAPAVPVLYISIKPSIARWEHIDDIREANALIEAMCKADPYLFFVDVEKAMLNESGEPEPSLLRSDKLHMTDAGYAIWVRLLNPYLNISDHIDQLGKKLTSDFLNHMDIGKFMNAMPGNMDYPEHSRSMLFQSPDGNGRIVFWNDSESESNLWGQAVLKLEGPASLVQMPIPDLLSPRVVRTWAGTQPAGVTLKAEETLKVSLEGAPSGITLEHAQQADNRRTYELVADETVGVGVYAVTLHTSDEGWDKSWDMLVRVLPELEAWAAPFVPGEAQPIVMRSLSDRTLTVDVEGVGPASTQVAVPPEGAELSWKADASHALAPVSIELQPQSGTPAIIESRPGLFEVPHATIVLDGDLSDWPATAAMSADDMAGQVPDGDAAVYLAWDQGGVYMAVRLPFDEQAVGDPMKFWSTPNVEFFVDVDASNDDPQASSVHQFWLAPAPTDDGSWRAYPGEWQRSKAIVETIYDDARIHAAAHVADGVLTMEALIPVGALGVQPVAGESWHGNISSHATKPGERGKQFAWPVEGAHPARRTPATWGVLRFVE